MSRNDIFFDMDTLEEAEAERDRVVEVANVEESEGPPIAPATPESEHSQVTVSTLPSKDPNALSATPLPRRYADPCEMSAVIFAASAISATEPVEVPGVEHHSLPSTALTSKMAMSKTMMLMRFLAGHLLASRTTHHR